MYFLVSADAFDRDLLFKYSSNFTNCTKIFESENAAVYCIDEISRGHREKIYEISREHQCSHMFFDDRVQYFHEHKLLISDMDSTLISIECIDVLADYHGCAEEVSRLTAEAMADQRVDYQASLRKRVRLLAGFAESKLPEIYEQYVRVSPGAERLLELAHTSGMHTTIVSGGFTYFTERLCDQLKMSSHVGNELEVCDGTFTGELAGDLVDGKFKAHTLRKLQSRLGLTRQDVIALGDGANDLPMMQKAGLAVGYRPKKVVGKYADAVLFDDLDRLLQMLRCGKEAIQENRLSSIRR